MNSIGDVSEPINNSTSIWSAWKSDVGCVFDRDPAARSVFEVLTTYPGVHAILVHRVSHKLWLRKFRYAARLLSFFARLLSNVDIHPGAQIGKRFFIDHGACVVIGETAIVGDDVTLYHGVTLGGTSWNKGRRHPTLGNGVLVGTGAKILGPIEVASGARIGANSVVVQDVPSNSTVVGIPGRVVQNKPRDAASLGGVNLDHHLIPDPVGKAMGCLLERIDVLENKLQNIQKMGVVYPLELTRDCDPDTDICAEQCPIGVRITASKAAGGMRGPAKF